MNTINGLCASVQGAELIDMAQGRVANAVERLEKLRESLTRVSEMSPEDREIAGMKLSRGDMKDEVEKKIKDQEQALKFYDFMAEHLESDSVYRLSTSDLKLFDIKAPGMY